MTPDAARRIQAAMDRKIAEQPTPKVVAEANAAKSRVMSAADKGDSN